MTSEQNMGMRTSSTFCTCIAEGVAKHRSAPRMQAQLPGQSRCASPRMLVPCRARRASGFLSRSLRTVADTDATLVARRPPGTGVLETSSWVRQPLWLVAARPAQCCVLLLARRAPRSPETRARSQRTQGTPITAPSPPRRCTHWQLARAPSSEPLSLPRVAASACAIGLPNPAPSREALRLGLSARVLGASEHAAALHMSYGAPQTSTPHAPALLSFHLARTGLLPCHDPSRLPSTMPAEQQPDRPPAP
ncbi:hypothetical protein DPSP01_013462 [Paraphaeosphaeria sporulosa]